MTAPYRLHASLGYQLSLAARLQERRLDEGLRALGLSRISWCVLLAIGNEDLRQPSDIASFVGIDRTATSRALRQMQADGLIERGCGTGDRRTRTVCLTSKGLSLLENGTPLAQQNNAIMEARLSATELTALRVMLEKLHEGEETKLSRL